MTSRKNWQFLFEGKNTINIYFPKMMEYFLETRFLLLSKLTKRTKTIHFTPRTGSSNFKPPFKKIKGAEVQ